MSNLIYQNFYQLNFPCKINTFSHFQVKIPHSIRIILLFMRVTYFPMIITEKQAEVAKISLFPTFLVGFNHKINLLFSDNCYQKSRLLTIHISPKYTLLRTTRIFVNIFMPLLITHSIPCPKSLDFPIFPGIL